ncbi:hypothetical protein ACFVVX_03965 [Kitasatospora sp. NPDC058170]|uniref:hypothetical protein n=1 Tax=Kitasatospora sp. NPDC058170 TaxID=3346364 RepID=UPI0036D85758
MSAPENLPSADEPVDGPVPVPDPDPAEYAPFAGLPGAPAAAAPARRLPRAVGVVLATAGLLAVTAASAAVTVAVGRPDERSTVVAAGLTGRPSASASAGPSASLSASPGQSASASASPSASATAAPKPSPTASAPAPRPTSTLKGGVSGGSHSGDLRYFLLPIPDGGESYGPSDGVMMTDEEIAEGYKQADIMDVLKSYGYKEAATRTYRTADGKAEVTVELMRFGSPSMAKDFAKGSTLKQTDTIEIEGDPSAHAYRFTPRQQAFTGSMVGISNSGDVQYTITVDVKGTPDKALLNDVMKRQRERLASGG